MARSASRHPTELELEILKVLWQGGPASVRQVREALADSRPLAHTSVMTIMNIMAKKGYVRRSKEGGCYVYRPRVSRTTTARRMLGDVVERVFDGSAMAVVLNLLETADLDAQELEELRALLERKSEGQSP